jgi:membrane protein
MLQKIIVILFAIILILFNSVGREKINRKLLIFLSSIIVLNAILLIVRQVTGQEMELFSFLAIENDSGQFPIVRLLLEIVISLAILIKSMGAAKFRKDIALFGAAFIATQALMDYPGVISQLMEYDLLREVLFVLLYLCLASLACRERKHPAEK